MSTVYFILFLLLFELCNRKTIPVPSQIPATLAPTAAETYDVDDVIPMSKPADIQIPPPPSRSVPVATFDVRWLDAIYLNSLKRGELNEICFKLYIPAKGKSIDLIPQIISKATAVANT